MKSRSILIKNIVFFGFFMICTGALLFISVCERAATREDDEVFSPADWSSSVRLDAQSYDNAVEKSSVSDTGSLLLVPLKSTDGHFVVPSVARNESHEDVSVWLNQGFSVDTIANSVLRRNSTGTILASFEVDPENCLLLVRYSTAPYAELRKLPDFSLLKVLPDNIRVSGSMGLEWNWMNGQRLLGFCLIQRDPADNKQLTASQIESEKGIRNVRLFVYSCKKDHFDEFDWSRFPEVDHVVDVISVQADGIVKCSAIMVDGRSESIELRLQLE